MCSSCCAPNSQCSASSYNPLTKAYIDSPVFCIRWWKHTRSCISFLRGMKCLLNFSTTSFTVSVIQNEVNIVPRLWLHGIKQSVNLNITFLFVQLCSDPKSCEALDPQRPCGGLAEVEWLCSLIHQHLYLVKQVRRTSDTMSYTHSHWVLFLSLKDLFRATATNPTHVNVCKHLRLPLFSSRLLYYIMHPYPLWIT